MRVVWLSLGGVLGVNARYWLAVAIDHALLSRFPSATRFPWATLTINVSGAFVLGFLATMLARLGAHHPARLFALVGFLGGYTTFSTFALEAHKLADAESIGRSLIYMIGSLVGGVIAVTLGILLARSVGFDSGPYPQRSASVAGLTATPEGGVELAEVD